MGCCHGYAPVGATRAASPSTCRPSRSGRACWREAGARSSRALGASASRCSPTRALASCSRWRPRCAVGARGGPRRRGLRRGARRADGRVLPARRRASRATGASTATSRSAAARSSTRARPRPLYATLPGRAARVRQRARRRRAAGPGSAAAARRLPDHVRDGQRVHRHRRVRRSDAEGQDRASPRGACGPRSRSSTRPRRARCRAMVVAASGFDVLCHALESYTARPFTARTGPGGPGARPMSQGRNPWSDVGSLEALRLAGRYLVRAVRDATRRRGARGARVGGDARGHRVRQRGRPPAARHELLGRRPGARLPLPRLPAARAARAARHLGRRQRARVFRATAATSPERHLARPPRSGADVRGASPADAGEILARRLVASACAPPACRGPSRAWATPRATSSALARGAVVQKRLVDNAPHARRRGRRCAPSSAGALGRWLTPSTRAGYRHFLPIPTRWMDNDVYGHVNNVVYYAYFDTVINRVPRRRGRPRHRARRRSSASASSRTAPTRSPRRSPRRSRRACASSTWAARASATASASSRAATPRPSRRGVVRPRLRGPRDAPPDAHPGPHARRPDAPVTGGVGVGVGSARVGLRRLHRAV